MQGNYPLHLVPTKGLTLITEDDLDLSHVLGKWVEPGETFKNSDGKLDFSAIPLKRIPGCSSNKIPDSVSSDLCIKFKPDFANIYKPAWIEGEDGIIPDDKHFEMIDDRNIFFLKIEDIHNVSDSFSHPTNKAKPVYKFTLKVVHKPLVSNYWHFEFDIETDLPYKINSDTPEWREKICTTIMDQVQEKAFFELP